MAVPRLWVDFNASSADGGLWLTTVGTRRDLEEQGLELYEGLRLTVWQEDDPGFELEADAVVYWDQGWSARPGEIRQVRRNKPE
jgi:hypothetical protein